jgi:small membrane protein
MIIQILLSLGFVFVLLLYLMNARLASPMSVFALSGAGFGLTIVWFPEIMNTVAHMVGVGRGADLITYCFAMIGIALFEIIFLKIRQLNQHITQIVREAAVAKAEASRSNSGKKP